MRIISRPSTRLCHEQKYLTFLFQMHPKEMRMQLQQNLADEEPEPLLALQDEVQHDFYIKTRWMRRIVFLTCPRLW